MSVPVQKIRQYKLHEIYSEKAFESLLQEPDLGTQFFILGQATPTLPKEVIRDVIAFAYLAKRLVKMKRPIVLSEVIIWGKRLEVYKVKRLSKEVIENTITQLPCREEQILTILAATDRILKIIHKKYYQTSE